MSNGLAQTAPALRHARGEPVRFVHKTERQCCRCGLVKVTRHEGDEHWVEFWRDEEKVAQPHHGRVLTPPCAAFPIPPTETTHAAKEAA